MGIPGSLAVTTKQKRKKKTQQNPSLSAPKCNFLVQNFVLLFVLLFVVFVLFLCFCLCFFCAFVCVFFCDVLCVCLCLFLRSSVGEMLPVFLPTAEGLGLVYFFALWFVLFFGGLKQKAPFKKARIKDKKKKHEKNDILHILHQVVVVAAVVVVVVVLLVLVVVVAAVVLLMGARRFRENAG